MPAKKEIFGGEKRATGDVQASRVLEMYVPAVGGLGFGCEQEVDCIFCAWRQALVDSTVNQDSSQLANGPIDPLGTRNLAAAPNSFENRQGRMSDVVVFLKTACPSLPS